MMLLRKAYQSFPKPLKLLLHPLVERYYQAGYRPLANQLSGFKLSGRDAKVYEANYEKNLVNLLEQIVHEGDICVDVGAYMGFITLLFVKFVGETGYVYAFDAHPANAKIVLHNIQQNNMTQRVKIENIAIADSVTKLKIYAGRNNATAEWNIVGHDVDGNPTPTKAVLEIRATSLDAYFADIPGVSIIKLDIEGAEALALAGMSRLLNEQRPVVVIEFHNDEGWQGRETLVQANYSLYDINLKQWLADLLNHPRVYHCFAVPSEKIDVWKPILKHSETVQK